MRKLTLCLLAVFFSVCPQLFARGIREGAGFYNSRGLEYLENGEYDLAIEDFSRAIRMEPDNAEFYSNRGGAYGNKSEYAQAIEDFSSAILLDPDNADFYYYRGNAYFNKGEYDPAIENYSSAILLDPENAYLYYYRGNVYLWKGEYDQAIENYSSAILLDPDNADFYYSRGYAYSYKEEYDPAIEDFSSAILLNQDNTDFYYYRGNAYFNKGEYDPAIEDYSSAILLDPENAYFYYYRGNVYFWKGEYDQAIENYSSAIQLNQENADFYYSRGYAYSYKEEYDPAIEDYSSAILLDPDNTDFYNSRGELYNSKGEYDRAIEDSSYAILLDPNSAVAYFNHGQAYYNKGDYDQAIADYSQAILLDPNYVVAYVNRGTAYYNKGEYDRAIENFSQGILFNPNTAEIYFGRGIAYYNKGEYDRAIEDFSQGILLNPNTAEIYYIRGSVYNEKGEYDRAIEDFSQGILLDPNFTGAYNNRGLAYLGKEEYDLAIEDFSYAIMLDANYEIAYINRGGVHSIKGDYDRAIEDYSQAILLDPNDETAYNNRGGTYYRKGDYNRAIEDFSQAILLGDTYAYINRGRVYKYKGQYKRAIDDYKEALNVAEISININEIFIFTMSYAYDIYTDYPYLSIEKDPFIKKYFAGLTMDGISRSVRRAEQVRSNLGVRGSAIMTRVLYFYYMGVDLEARFGSPEKTFEYSESLRSRGFLDQIGTEAALRLPGIREEERERVRYLLNEIENRQNVLNNFRERPPQNKEEELSFVSAGQTLSVLESELAALDTDISSRIPQYAELRNPVPASLAQAQEWLDGDTAVLIYALWDESIDFTPIRGLFFGGSTDRPTVNSYCLVLTKDGLTAVILDHDFNYMQAINNLRDEINHRNRERRTGLMEPIRNDLYNALIKPVLPSIPDNIKNLIIVPDGTLGHLPFDILREDYDSPDLGETYRLTLSPSISVSMLLEKSTPQNLPILAFGGAWYNRDRTAAERGEQRSAVYGNEPKQITWLDLSASEAEVRMLEQMVPSASDIRVIMGSDVSEEQIKRLSAEGELARYPMLHFATHGYFREEDLDRAGIVLSEVSGLLNNEEDGYLTIPEIAVLNLDARMVLLSACETGLGVLRRGDGMVGMVRAFLLAGSEYVGVSLWEIDDEATLEFMTRLYSKVINEGITFKEAYYLVKNEFRHHDELDHPYYWSAFVLYE